MYSIYGLEPYSIGLMIASSPAIGIIVFTSHFFIGKILVKFNHKINVVLDLLPSEMVNKSIAKG